MAGFFRTRRTNFTTALIGQEHKLYFSPEAQAEQGRPRTFTAIYMGQRLLSAGWTSEELVRASTEVYLQLSTGADLTVRLSEIEFLYPPRNDKRDQARRAEADGRATQPRRKGRSIPLDLATALPADDLRPFSFLDDGEEEEEEEDEERVPEREEIEREIEDAWHATAEAKTNLPV